MKVTVNIDDRDFWQLANRAEREGVKVADLLAAMFRTAGGMKQYAPVVFRDHVAELAHAGIPDPVIAHRLGQPLESVRAARRALGITAVKFRREHWVHELSRPATRATDTDMRRTA